MARLLALKIVWLSVLTLGDWYGELTVVSTDSKQLLAPVQLWADFGSASYLPNEQAGIRHCREDGDLFCGLTDSDAAFVSKTYSVISLEKCFGVRPHQSNHTETNFVKTATQIARLTPQDRPPPQVLFYWSSNVAVADCYEDLNGGLILKHPEWWLKNRTGGYIWSDVHHVGKRPFIDFTVPAAAAWWVSVPMAVRSLAGDAMAGVFADAAGDWADNLLGQITQKKATELNAAHRTTLATLHAELHRAIGRNALLLGNALGPCTAGRHCSADGVSLLRDKIIDGVCGEHFGAFEWSNNQTTGAVNPAAVNEWLDLLDAAAATNGSVFIKTWAGPETGPIDGEGPSWPTSFRNPSNGQPLNRTSQGIGQAAASMINYSLACYLCVYQPGFSFSYGWWYDVAQGYIPGADAPNSWYPQLGKPLGEPTSPARIAGRNIEGSPIVCERDFEGAHVTVDFLDWGSANITWK